MNNSSLNNHLAKFSLQDRRTAIAYINLNKTIEQLQGDFSFFGTSPKLGKKALLELPFLTGLLANHEELQLSWLQLSENIYADLHLVPDKTGTWLLLRETSVEARLQQTLQQAYSELEFKDLVTPALFKDLFAVFDTAIFEVKDNVLLRLGAEPKWLQKMWPQQDSAYWNLNENSFLEHFLLTCENRTNKTSEKQYSGIWSEKDDSGQEHYFEAYELYQNQQRILIVKALGQSEMQLISHLQESRANEIQLSEQKEDLNEALEALHQNQNQLRDIAFHDELTGLYNRRAFDKLANQHLKLAKRNNQDMILFYFDINNFKVINDTQGHAMGDLAIKKMAASFKEVFRESDLMARMGGDEFVVLAQGLQKDDSKNIIHRLEEILANYNNQDSISFPLFTSVGTVIYDPHKHSSLALLIADADKKMYRKKQAFKVKAAKPFLKPRVLKNAKNIRRFLADARDKKQLAEAKALTINWSKSRFLVSSQRFLELQTYFAETNDSFALQHDASTNKWFLFNVLLLEDTALLDTALAELAINIKQKIY